ncbi:restriction endonuclease subunit S [Oribacterium sp. FC2011]|uniref:restriction endonuclease subunit S n=1 Tax=Oribacterium sp. FC2011 TaxID=1408311 RepID=UPI0004E22BC6|nr:restriction endonuclease subunit S [Oribacterium sp. FC2011]
MRKMKDSQLEWIGEIPDDWAVKPIRAEFEEVTQKNKSGDVKVALKFTYGDIVRKENFDADEDAYVADTMLNYTVVKPGTIMLNGLNLNFDFVSQRIGLVHEVGAITSAYMAFRPISNRVTPEFATYLFKAYDGCKAFHNMGGGVRKILNFSEFKKYYMFYPDVETQKRIVSYLDKLCIEVDEAINEVSSQIDVLEQYKRSVITESVTKGVKPDVEMRDSCIQWIGMMPSHWEVIRGKYILTYVQKPVREDDGVITCFRDGEVTLRSNRREEGFTMSDKEIGYQGIDVGDLVVHGMDGFAGSIGISDSRGKASPVLNVLDTKQNKRYIMYYLRSMAYSDVFLALATGIRVRSCDLRWNKLAELSYPVPPLEEQQAIVDHIDSVIEKTDAVIADKKAQLETLDEYKKSLIFEYVTGKKEVPIA